MTNLFSQAAAAITRADAIIIAAGAGIGVDSGLPDIAAGAGIGVDSGLPDFRGNTGFWAAYPPFAQRGLKFAEVSNPKWFDQDPEMAWGFYGHRLNLYRRSTPHAGFKMLLNWVKDKPEKYFVFTSNVDGHFQRAGFDTNRIFEIHGAIEYLQCSVPCRPEIWPVGNLVIEIDEETFRASTPLPACPHCGEVARPNVLMFSDGRWVGHRSGEQEERYNAWQIPLDVQTLTIIECGAGTAVPSVRHASDYLQQAGATLIRINPREAQGPRGTISLECGALEGLESINARLA